MPVRSWRFHTIRWLISAAFILIAGWLTGTTYPLLVLSLSTWSAWHIINAWRLYRWIRNPTEDIPESYGIWSEIFDGIRSLQKQKYISVITDFQSLTDAFPDATVVINQGGRITWFNNSAEELLGLNKPGDFGQAITNLLRSSLFSEWFNTENNARKPLHIPSPRDENTWLEVSAVTFGEDQTLIILRNITEFHNVEQVRRDFVANISHELRSPLTVIFGYLELLQSHPEKEVSDVIGRMLGQASQIQVLLDDLLELSRLQSDEIQDIEETIDIPRVIMRLKKQGEELSKGQHQIEFETEEELGLIGVVSDLESAFINLIANAVKYTPKGGKLVVKWTDTPQGPQFSISDNGIGIPRKDIPRLTERFYRVGSDRARLTGGSGLGLAIVKHVMNAHEATLMIESELGEGSTFTCTFPAARRIKPANFIDNPASK